MPSAGVWGCTSHLKFRTHPFYLHVQDYAIAPTWWVGALICAQFFSDWERLCRYGQIFFDQIDQGISIVGLVHKGECTTFERPLAMVTDRPS